MSERCYLGIDVGTSSAKAVLISSAGKLLASASSAYSCMLPRPGWSEANPEDWWQGCKSAIQDLFRQRPEARAGLAAIGLTGQMHGLVCLDAERKVLRRAILWNDQRCGEECRILNSKLGERRYNELAGSPALPGFTAPKMVWMQRHEPKLWERVVTVLLPKDYVRYRLTGELATDVADASGIGLLDVGRRRWSAELCRACGVDPSILPRLLESPEVSGCVTPECAAELGLSKSVPVIAGAGDQASSAVGCGVVEPGTVACSLGTSGVLFAPALRYAPEPNGRLHTFCAATPDTWHWMGVQLSSAGSLDWWVKSVLRGAGEGDAFTLLLDEAQAVAPGCEGLTFLPYLSGERTPHADPDARGAFVGFSLVHTRAHATRAVIEGVSFGLNQILDLLRVLGLRPARMVTTGGGARSTFWLQLLANLMQMEVITTEGADGAAVGAAILAATGSGDFSSVKDATAAMVQFAGCIQPTTDGSEYAEAQARFDALYHDLRPAFARIALG